MDNATSVDWVDNVSQSTKNEKWLSTNMLTSRNHRRKTANKSAPGATARANTKKSSIPTRVEKVFAQQKMRYGQLPEPLA